MANNPQKDTTVKYVNRDFASLKRDLMAYAQAHFSGAFQDFNEASPGMAILELQAYVGDVLSYYLDQQFLELKQETARQLENVEDFAKMRGYKPRGKRSASVMESWIVEVPAASGTNTPDLRFAPIIKMGSQAGGPAGTAFETSADLDMSASATDNPQKIVASQYDQNGNPTYFAIRRDIEMFAGTTVTETLSVGDFTQWPRLELGNPDVLEVLSVIDSDGNPWYEVEYLAQNMVFSPVVNTGSDASVVPYVLRFVSAPRRFVLERSLSQGKAWLQFGPGQGLKFDDEIIPDIANLALPLPGRSTFTNFTLDPQNFLKTRSMGLAPYNTILTVKYRVGGGDQTNVPATTITSVNNAILEFRDTSLDPTALGKVKSSVECINVLASSGGGPEETIAEIKANSTSYFAAQARAVTKEDYLTHVLSMPSKFGKPEKVYVTVSTTDKDSIDIHVIPLGADGKLVPATSDQKPLTLYTNIQTYLTKLRMITEGVNIRPGYVINVGVDFGVVISPRYNRNEVMTNCLNAVKTYLDTGSMQIRQPIVYSDLESTLQAIDGVISVYKLAIKSFFLPRNGLTYSQDISFDVDANTKHGIVYCPENAIFEVRYPESDIVGESK